VRSFDFHGSELTPLERPRLDNSRPLTLLAEVPAETFVVRVEDDIVEVEA